MGQRWTAGGRPVSSRCATGLRSAGDLPVVAGPCRRPPAAATIYVERRRRSVSRVVALSQPREIYTDPFWAATDQRGQRIAHRVPAVVVARSELREYVVGAWVDLVAPEPRLLDEPPAAWVD